MKEAISPARVDVERQARMTVIEGVLDHRFGPGHATQHRELAQDIAEALDSLSGPEVEHRVCEGCGSSRSAEELRAGGHVSCCPERKMLTAKEWSARADALQAEVERVREDVAAYAAVAKQQREWKGEAEAERDALKRTVKELEATIENGEAWMDGFKAQVRVRDLEEAMEPFAKRANQHEARSNGPYATKDSYRLDVRLGDCRRARALLAPPVQGEE